MKRFLTSIVMGMFLLWGGVVFIAPSFGEDSVTVSTKATVPESLELSYWIRWSTEGQDPYEFGYSGDATSIDFGELEWNENLGIWLPTKYYTVFLIARTSGRPYQIKQTSTGLVSGDNNLNNSFIMDPDYQADDKYSNGVAQGDMPAGDSLGEAGLAAQGERIVYDSNSGKSRIIRVYYGISTGEPGTPGEPITGDQPAGNYSGTVAFTLTLK